MADPVWVDGVTPVNAVNLNKTQTRDEKGAPSGYAPLDAGSKVPVANIPSLATTYQPISQKNQPSGYVGIDASNNVNVVGNVNAGQVYATGVNPGATVYVSAAQGEAGWRHYTDASGKHFWGDGAGTFDTNLYRQAPNILKTDGALIVGLDVSFGRFFSVSQAGDVQNRLLIDNTGKVQWSAGSGSLDTNLYRAGAGYLRTDGGVSINGAGHNLDVGGAVYVDYANGGARLYFGSSGDTSLFRYSSSSLRTTGQFIADANVIVGFTSDPTLYFGSGIDAKLYRGAVGQLFTNAALQLQGTYTAGVGMCNIAIGSNRGSGNVTNWVEIGAPDSGGAGYRMLRVPN